MFNPREGQQDIIRYHAGMLGITAVPGSGKTHTLSYLAAKLIADDRIQEDQEILIVTLVNSAVNNFASRISEFLKSFGLVPGIGYRVRTLHGLAYDIVREQPQLAGMDNQFSIADERTSNDIISIASINWIRTYPEAILELSADNVDPDRQKNNWANLVQSIANNSINFCKDMLISPDDLLQQTQLMKDPLFAMVQKIYTDYERALYDRGSVDFSDLIRLAFTILKNNPGYLSILQDRWPYILEDEAQDSSKIQEELLTLLSSRSNNWVRVGDPNQAIFETFTTADPRLLRQFVSRSDVAGVDLPRSGRSTRSIISLANHLINWTRQEHPEKELRYALDIPLIKPTAANDPQPNPMDAPEMVHIYNQELTPEKEIEVVATSACKWLQENPDKTLAILIPRNARGAEMVEALSKRHVSVFELLSTSRTTRETASVLAEIFTFFAKPLIRRHLTNAFASVAMEISDVEQTTKMIEAIVRKLKTIKNPEILFSLPNGLEEFASQNQINGQEKTLLSDVFSKLQYWQSALLLPIDECTITIGSDLFRDAADLALTHKIALILQKAKEYYPDWTIENFAEELHAIASNRYKLHGFSDDNFGFDPDQHKGKAVVSTMHKAKGLEWDRVYLMSVNNYNFPSLAENDEYVSEKWFVKDRRNLEAEVVQKIRTIQPDGQIVKNDLIRKASHQARVEFCAERLRLLYVGITRARQELIITWNNGKRNNCVEALPLKALREFLETKRAE
jgi:DNA helicase-2/ATP-dependent DNA helicase PcrA